MADKEEFKFDANAVLMFVYIMYKCNMLSNHNVKNMLKIIKESNGVDVAKVIATAAGKAT